VEEQFAFSRIFIGFLSPPLDKSLFWTSSIFICPYMHLTPHGRSQHLRWVFWWLNCQKRITTQPFWLKTLIEK